MAAVDTPRALKLAESVVDGASRAQAVGVIAQAVAAKDRKAATDLLRRAYALLEAEAVRPDPPRLTSPLTAGSVAAVLVFNAAAIDPALVEECLWRAVALARKATEDPEQIWRYRSTNNALAMVAAGYDAKLAELLLPAPSREWQAREQQLADFLVNPQRAAEAVEKSASPERRAQDLAQLLGYAGIAENQIPRLIFRTLGIWRIDVEDIDL